MAAMHEGRIASRSSPLMEEEEHQRKNDGGNDDVKELACLVSKLNPSAEEFIPSASHPASSRLSADAPAFVALLNRNGPAIDGGDGSASAAQLLRMRKNNYNQRHRKDSARIHRAQKEECIKRTVYVSDVGQHVSEEQLAAIFSSCGKVTEAPNHISEIVVILRRNYSSYTVLDCRICGDPNSVLRFAFVEYANENAARQALNLDGIVVGQYPIKVMPSKTAILPVNPTFLPRSEDEREMCARTIYCTDIDRQTSQTDIKNFFESFCGKVSRLRLLGDHAHSTRIGFVEFVKADSAIRALNCSGFVLGSCPIRVSPSKTPVRYAEPAETLAP